MSALSLFLAAGSPDWVEIIVVVLLLFGGGIQAIIKKLRGEDGKPPTRAPRPSGDQGASGGGVKGGLDRWRELARGEARSEAPTIRREPIGAEARSEARSEEGGGGSTIQREPIGAEVRRAPRPRRPQTVASAPPAPPPVPADSRWGELHDEDDFSQYAGEPGEADLKRRQKEARAAEEALMARPKRTAAARVREDVPMRLRLRHRHEWRDAIVAAEVLGRPVGMRRREELPGNAHR